MSQQRSLLLKQQPKTVLSEEQLKEASKAAAKVKSLFPSLFMGLNTAQIRALDDMYRLEESGNLPDLNSIEFANGVGKSHLMILDIVGWVMGVGYLDEESYPESALDFYRKLESKRNSGKMALRLVCTADDMKAGGSVYELMKNIFPWARPTKQDNTGCFRQIDIPHPTLPLVINHIAVKTFDQPEDKHSGTTCDRIWSNENLPENIWAETSARTRGGGNIAMFATILDYASYLDELEGSQRFCMRRSKGHIYENCRGEEVTAEMSSEVLSEIGVMLEKDKDGSGYITGGVLRRAKIEALIEGWERTCPHQVKARKTGQPISSGGKIHPLWNSLVHEMGYKYLEKIPEEYPIVQVVDPHPARPDACAWAAILPNNRLHIFAEWPTYDGFGYFESIKDKRFTVTQKCELWRKMESDMGINVCTRIGDPNRFKTPNSHNFEQLHSLYAAHGFSFYLGVNDNFELGVERVNEYLWYDQVINKLHPEDPAGRPRLTVANVCVNTCRGLKNFTRKISRDRTAPIKGTIDEKYKDFPDIIRYLVMWHKGHSFEELVQDQKETGGDYERYLSGSVPGRYRGDRFEFNHHGRKVLERA